MGQVERRAKYYFCGSVTLLQDMRENFPAVLCTYVQ